MSKKLAREIQSALLEYATEENRTTAARFFKEDDGAKVLGIKSKEVQLIAKEFKKQIKGFSKKEVFELCEELWKSGYLEEKVIACSFSESQKKLYEPEDFNTFEHWVKSYVNNWADCDTLCNHTVGEFVMKFPEYLRELKKWAESDQRFVKRAAVVTLIIPARKGLFLPDIFEIADILLLDSDDLVRKGYGWMLKAASQAHQQEVFEYVLANKAEMPRTSLRYAIEKMPKEMKEEAMRR